MEVLIIGLGSVAQKHIVALRSITDKVNFYALRKAGSDVHPGVSNIETLGNLPVTPDFVIISNPTNLHRDAILSVIDLGVPLLIEKPPLHNLEGASDIVAKLKKSGIATYVACNLRFHPCVKFLKSFFQKNTEPVNEVNVYCGSYLPAWRPGKDYKNIYSARSEMGGGVHLDLFHELDYTQWIFGLPNASRGFFSSKSTLDISAMDYANYLLEYERFNINVVLNYYRSSAKRTIEILFHDQTWEVDLLKCSVVSDLGGVIFESQGYSVLDTYKEQMQYFVQDVIRTGESINAIEDSLATLKIALNE